MNSRCMACVVLALTIAPYVYASRVAIHYGQWMNIGFASMSTSFVGGTALTTLAGTEEIDCPIRAIFANGSTLTSQEFQLQTSDDNTNWTAIPSIRVTSGVSLVTHSVTAVVNSTVYDRLLTTDHRVAKYVRMAAKYTGGAAAGGDAQQSDLNYSLVVP
jgi:hypothetical protein